MKTTIITILILLCTLFAYYCSKQARHYPDPFKTDKVPTFIELQELVGAEPDGIIGPNTIAKWDRKICDQYAIEAMEQMAGDTK